MYQIFFLSVWEKYSNEIGKQDGPLRHIDEDCGKLAHLNGFVAFDMEHWWAERSISCMINKKDSSEYLHEPKSIEKQENSLLNTFNMKLSSKQTMQKSMQTLNIAQMCMC